MKILVLFLVSVVFSVSGCSVVNMFAGPADYERHYAAIGLKESIDRAVMEELRKERPNGFETYSSFHWQTYWNLRLKAILQNARGEHYRGPSGEEFAVYIVRQRKSVGLPKLILTPENRRKMRMISIPGGI